MSNLAEELAKISQEGKATAQQEQAARIAARWREHGPAAIERINKSLRSHAASGASYATIFLSDAEYGIAEQIQTHYTNEKLTVTSRGIDQGCRRKVLVIGWAT